MMEECDAVTAFVPWRAYISAICRIQAAKAYAYDRDYYHEVADSDQWEDSSYDG